MSTGQLQRAQILDAAISAPNEFGYGAVTNGVVARLAGVSRRAMIHHFPTRRELLATTTSYAHEKLTACRGAQLEKSASGVPRFRPIIDLAFETANRPEGPAVKEIRAGVPSDPDIVKAVIPVMTHISDDHRRFLRRHVGAAGPRAGPRTPGAECCGCDDGLRDGDQPRDLTQSADHRERASDAETRPRAISAKQLGPDKALKADRLETEPPAFLLKKKARLEMSAA